MSFRKGVHTTRLEKYVHGKRHFPWYKFYCYEEKKAACVNHSCPSVWGYAQSIIGAPKIASKISAQRS